MLPHPIYACDVVTSFNCTFKENVENSNKKLGFLFKSCFQSSLNGSEQSGEDVVVLQLLAEEQPLDGVVVGEEGYHVLQEEALAVGQQLSGVVDLGVDVVGHDVADVDL